jgi:hypothetical protein
LGGLPAINEKNNLRFEILLPEVTRSKDIIVKSWYGRIEFKRTFHVKPLSTDFNRVRNGYPAKL